MTYNSYSSDTPSTKHPWHNNSFYDILDIQQDLINNDKRRAAERQQQIEDEKVRLRIAKVQQLYTKRVSIDNIAFAMGISKQQVIEDIELIENAMYQRIQTHTANINQEEQYIPTTDAEVEFEKARRKFHMTGDYEPKNSGGYVAYFH